MDNEGSTKGPSHSAKSSRQIAAVVPNPSKCKARLVAVGHEPAWCLARQGARCRFSLPYGSSLLCGHPDRAQIVARTKAAAGEEFTFRPVLADHVSIKGSR